MLFGQLQPRSFSFASICLSKIGYLLIAGFCVVLQTGFVETLEFISSFIF